MKFQVGHPAFLLLLPLALGWIYWLARNSDVQVGCFRRWAAFGLRCISVAAFVLALAELQFLWPLPGMNVFYLLDRSDSIPPAQLESSRSYVNKSVYAKDPADQAGVIVFGSDANIEATVSPTAKLDKVESVVGQERTDIAGAIQLAAAGFPESGQKRLVLLSDGNENVGDAVAAAVQARALGISIDVVPLDIQRGNDISVQRLVIPPNVKKGRAFEAKVFIDADQPQPAFVSLYRNEQFLGRQKVNLSAGKNLFTFLQNLPEAGFYNYDVRVEAEGDSIPDNNRATAFTSVRGNPRVLIISSDLAVDQPLVAALQSAQLEINTVSVNAVPGSVAEMQSYDAIFLSNVAAGDLGTDTQKLLESAVRDFGVGLVCIGGDQAYGAGAYRGTPLETILPVDMEADSKKVLPGGALVLVIDRSGSMAGPKIEAVKDAAIGAVMALADNDYVAVLTFDESVYTVAEMQKAANKKPILQSIAGITAGGGTAMYPPLVQAHDLLKNVPANLKHCIVLTDGDSLPGDFDGITRAMAKDKMTVSTVGVGADINESLLQSIAVQGKGRFYKVTSPDVIPQIFIKETSVILKSVIDENPFKPQLRSPDEIVRGIPAAEYPALRGYVITTAKSRAEIPLWTDKGDPLLAHWQYGLGRTVAFTSDARAKWAVDWLGWDRYRQFWTQVAEWSLRRVENSDFTTEVSVDGGRGLVGVEALDAQGNYRNFLDLKAVVVSPKGEKNTVALKQNGAGHYEAAFPVREVGLYMLNLLDEKNGQLQGSQVVGASVNYSPEYNDSKPNLNLLRRIAEISDGRMLNPENPTDENPFQHDRHATFRSVDLWQWLLRLAIVLFPLDVAVRRVQLDMEEVARVWGRLRSWLPGHAVLADSRPVETLAMLLARRDETRPGQPINSLPQHEPIISPAWTKMRPIDPEIRNETAQPEAELQATDSKAAASTTSRLLDAKWRAKERQRAIQQNAETSRTNRK